MTTASPRHQTDPGASFAPQIPSDPWLAAWGPDPATRPVIACLPQAGAGCGQFSAWQRALGDGIAVVGIQLPGREDRWSHPVCASVEEAVQEGTRALVRATSPDQPLVLFGHSFGGLLAFEIAHALAQHRAWPTALVVSACRAPHRWVGAGRGLAGRNDSLEELLATRGLDRYDIDEDTFELFLELLRRDAHLSLTYDNDVPRPVACPLEIWGADDDPTVAVADLDEWRDYAGGDVRLRRFSGGHYYPEDHTDQVLDLLARLADPAPVPSTGSA